MKILRLLTLALMTCFSVGASFAQDVTAVITYCGITDNLLGCGCDAGSRVAFADNVASWCMFWDRTANGIDPSDQPINPDSIGANFSCQPFNGEVFCGQVGNFYADPAFQLNTLPVAPDQPVFFIKISGTNCCWVSDTFRLGTGFQTIDLTADNFDCSNSPCPVGVAPTAPSNVQVSDDQYCTAVSVSWEHNGQDVTSFNLFYRANSTDPWTFAVPATASARTAEFAVCIDGSVEVGVVTVNGSQQSEPAVGVGRTFLRHFATPAYALNGNLLTMYFTSPPQGVRCGARLFFDLWCEGSFVNRLCEVTDPDQLLITQLTCTLPAVPGPDCMVIMRDSSTSGDFPTGCGFADTVEIVLASEDQSVLPREFSLSQNYPNPFNPSTVIEYSLPNAGEVDLAIFNLMGQRVATLANGKMSAGNYRATWNAESMATGMYFYRLQLGNQIITRKMLLMK